MNRSSPIRILLLAGIAAAFILGPLLTLKWFSGELPGSFWQPEGTTDNKIAADYIVPKTGASQSNYTLQWQAQKPEGIPALTLRLAPTDWFSVWSGREGNKVRESSGRPELIQLALLYPDTAHPPAGSRCHDNQTAFAGCRAGLARLTLVRDGGNWHIREILQGQEKLPSQTNLPYKQRSTRALMSFWTRTDKSSGAQEFHGWSCDGNTADSRRELALFFVFPEKGAAECFRTKNWWERFDPERFSYQKQPVYFECKPEGGCSANFLFQQRMAEINYEYIAPRDGAATRTALAEAGWLQLNRAYLQAQKADRLHLDLADADVQQESCRIFSQEAQRWLKQAEPEQAPPYDAAHYLQSTCRRSAETALLLVPDAPEKALPLLLGTIPAMQQSEKFQNRQNDFLHRLIEAKIIALEATGKANSIEMLEALLSTLQEAEKLSYEERMVRADETLPRIVELADLHFQALTPHQRQFLFTRVRLYYGNKEGYEKWLSLFKSLLGSMTRVLGENSSELLQPLQELSSKLGSMEDYPEQKKVADRITVVILAQPLPGKGNDPESEAARQRETAALHAISIYYNNGMRESRFNQAAELMTPLIARLEKSLGPDAGYTQAAHSYRQQLMDTQMETMGGGYRRY